MDVKRSQVYRDYSKFMNSRGLRVLRRQMRGADRLLVAAARSAGKHLPVKVRMAMIYESELAAQERRRAAISAPIEVERDGDKLIIKTDLDLPSIFNAMRGE